MKKRNLKIICFMLSLMTVIAMTTSVSAVGTQPTTFNEGSAWKISGLQNYLSSSFSLQLQPAINSWNNGLSVRSITINSNGAGRIGDLNFRDYDAFWGTSNQFLWDNRDAQAIYKDLTTSNSTCCSKHRATSFGIYLNTSSQLNTPILNQSDTYKQGLIAHELGHVLGLDDFENYGSNTTYLMNYANNLQTYNTPHSNERTQANNFWH